MKAIDDVIEPVCLLVIVKSFLQTPGRNHIALELTIMNICGKAFTRKDFEFELTLPLPRSHSFCGGTYNYCPSAFRSDDLKAYSFCTEHNFHRIKSDFSVFVYSL